jgi:dipeptide transport system ATP-binding protein
VLDRCRAQHPELTPDRDGRTRCFNPLQEIRA